MIHSVACHHRMLTLTLLTILFGLTLKVDADLLLRGTEKQQEQMNTEYANYMNEHQQMVNYGHMMGLQQGAYQGGMPN